MKAGSRNAEGGFWLGGFEGRNRGCKAAPWLARPDTYLWRHFAVVRWHGIGEVVRWQGMGELGSRAGVDKVVCDKMKKTSDAHEYTVASDGFWLAL